MAEEIKRCVIICASPYYQGDFIKNEIQEDDFVICADGGYDIAKEVGITPSLIAGDFDSSRLTVPSGGNVIALPVEKDDTDSFFCAKYAVRQGYKDLLLLGATGCRIDHMYANFALLQYVYRKGCSGVIKDRHSAVYYTEGSLTIHCKGKTVSVLPYGCANAEVTLRGFKYKADRLKMESFFPIGASNIATEEGSTVQVHSGGVLVIVNS